MRDYRSLLRWVDTDAAVLYLAIPNMLSNLSTPLLGLIDTTVAGHLGSAAALSGVALGTTAVNVLFFVFIFLRKGTTGLTAQALGRNNAEEMRASFARALLLGMGIGSVMILVRHSLQLGIFTLLGSPDREAESFAAVYFHARLFGAPAALSNLAIQGWLLGMQHSGTVLGQQVLLNASNAVLCIYLALPLSGYGQSLGPQGLGLATALANYITMFVGLFQVSRLVRQQEGRWSWDAVSRPDKVMELIHLNSTIFLRSLCLNVVMFMFTMISARFGSSLLSANTILMQFQMILSSGTDGFSNAAEALVGEAVGACDREALDNVVLSSCKVSVLVAVLASGGYGFFGGNLVAVLTDVETVRRDCETYLPWLIISPFISVWGFLLDGFFVGATLARQMRDSMIVACLSFLAVAAVGDYLDLGNNGLWAAYLAFMAARAIVLAWKYPQLRRLTEPGNSSTLKRSLVAEDAAL
eukprot:TRINITY_DN59491_c0_g1_i1.p1 TRINITY_DN59491_c0_g1~~TRINITY_DN59491_c0_g1_i1.p1  ORF type:complete len:496 (-),score=51.87 TRINITY_DN59491_c0_g1_i1:48-1454(-)